MRELQHGPGMGHMAHPKFWLAGHTAFDGTNCAVCSLILRKIGKTWCHQIKGLKCTKFSFAGAPPQTDPAGGAYSAPLDLAVFKGPTSKGGGRGKKKGGEQWRMGGPGGRSPIDQNLGPWSWLKHSLPQTQGKF